jgi:TolB-like protein
MMMRRGSWLLPALTALLLPVSTTAQETPDTRPGVAVLPFLQGISIGAEKETLDALSIGLQQILITELSQNAAMRVVERNVLRDLLAEQDLARDGRVDAGTAAKIGKLVGARYVFTGGFNDVNGQFRLDGRVVDVETSVIIRAEQVTDRRDNLYGIVMDMSQKITSGLKLPPLTREVQEQREVRRSEVPPEAVILYSQAQFFQDRGDVGRAKELYRRITRDFPELKEAREALDRIESTG